MTALTALTALTAPAAPAGPAVPTANVVPRSPSARRLLVPVAAKSIPQLSRLPQPDPPIYHALLRSWAEHGRTLPGRHDPEWARLAAPPAPGAGLTLPDRADDGR